MQFMGGCLWDKRWKKKIFTHTLRVDSNECDHFLWSGFGIKRTIELYTIDMKKSF